MPVTINASPTNGLVQTADGSGVMKLQSNGVTTNALAWVNFNGQLASPITPRAAYNVSSVTKSGTSAFTINFTNALADSNYAVIASVGTAGSTSSNGMIFTANPINTTSCFLNTRNGANADNAYDTNMVAIFGN